jgi:homoserine dehydrogenase
MFRPSAMASSKRPVNLALLGCGTVGGGVIRLLSANAAHLAARVGAPLVVRKVLVRDVIKDRVPECDRSLLTTNPDEVLGDPETDVVVEVMGGEEPAYDYIRRAMDARKGVVTANKMLLAARAHELVKRAVERGIDLAFEASVGGGIPIIRVLRDALASDSVESLYGIVNGTSNYILTRMREDGLPFGQALGEAQAKGYAEADPTLDIDGHDAAHKMSVLAMLAFGVKVEHGKIPTEGIRSIEPIDHRFADRFDLVIKHLAIGKDQGDRIELRVHPTLVRKSSVLANVSGVLNAIFLEGRALGPCLISGRGAGDMPTAVSVVADIVDVAKSQLAGAAGLSTRGISLEERPLVPLGEVETRYYLRFTGQDRPGVLSRIAGALGEHGVSIEQMVQDGRSVAPSEPVPIVMITHRALESGVVAAIKTISAADYVTDRTRVLRIEEV